MDPVAKLLLDYLKNVIYDPDQAVLNLEELPEGFRELGQGLTEFSQSVLETTALAKAISKGNLNIKLPPPKNEIAAPLKALHASLKHLTWQTQQVAKGDYQQRVDFMGDFSAAFNDMTGQLERQRNALLKEIEIRQKENHILMQNKNLFEILAEQIAQWIIVTDTDTGEWLFVSRGIDEALADPDSRQQLRKWLRRQAQAIVNKEETHARELELSNNTGVRYYSVSAHPLHWHQRNALAFVLTDVSSEREQLNNLQSIANYDTLTQIYNRHYGMQVLNEWLAAKYSFILCFVDIDNLKLVNDQFGHSEGDQYIIQVAKALREFSADAVACRIGGDEFMLLVQDWEPEDAKKRLETLRNHLARCRFGPAIAYEYSISYGVISVGSSNTMLAGDLLCAADERMYEYKRQYKIRRRNKPIQTLTDGQCC